jgi:nucleoside-diphosphate-sugar epimerase
MKRNIFLFTGFGFIGLNLIRILKKKFNIKVFGNKINFPFKLKLPKNKVNFIKCDFLDIKKLSRYNFKNSNIILTTTNSNKKGFLSKYKELIKFLESKAPKKIILISSVSIYGNKFPKKSLVNDYAKNCFEIEKICKKYIKNLIILRVANVFGILRIKPGLIEKLSLQYLDIKKFAFYKYNTTRSYIPVDELCLIINSFLSSKRTNGTYNVSNSSYFLDVKETLSLYETFYKRKIRLLKNKIKPVITNSRIIPSKFLLKLKYSRSKSFMDEIDKIDKFYKNFFNKKKTFKL